MILANSLHYGSTVCYVLVLQGEVRLAGSVAYGGQSAWILNRTLRDNVVLAGTYDEAAYRRVLQCCALLPDLRTLPAGDLTEIGEKVCPRQQTSSPSTFVS